MRSNSHFNLSNVVRVVLAVLCAVFGGNTLRAQQATPTKTALEFEGNKVFSNEELRQAGNTCLAGFSNSSDQDTPLDYCLHRVTSYMRSKGYLQARLSRARQVPIENGFMTVVSVEEGALFRLGTVQIDGAKVLSPGQIREMLDLKTGDIANADNIGEWLFERVKKTYGNLGYIQYTAEVQPKFNRKEGAQEGVADLAVTIEEGIAFTIASIQFVGNGSVGKDVLLREMFLRNGEVFSQELLDASLVRLSQSGEFETIDADRDVDFKVDKRAPQLGLIIHMKKRMGESAPQSQPIRRVISIQVP